MAQAKIRDELERLLGPETPPQDLTPVIGKRRSRTEDERWAWSFTAETDPGFVTISLRRTVTPTATTTAGDEDLEEDESQQQVAEVPFVLKLEVPEAYPKSEEEFITVSSRLRHLTALVEELTDFIYEEEPRKLTVTKVVNKIMGSHAKMNPQKKKSKTSEPSLEASEGEGGSAPKPKQSLTQPASTSSSKTAATSSQYDETEGAAADNDNDDEPMDEEGGNDGDDFFDETLLWGGEEGDTKEKAAQEDIFGVEDKWLDDHYEKKKWLEVSRARYYQLGEDDIRREADKKLALGTGVSSTPVTTEEDSNNLAIKLEAYRKNFEFSLGSLSNELAAIIKDHKSGKINFQAAPIDNDLFRWRVKLTNFSNHEAPIFAQLLEVEKRFGYKHVELEITFKPALYPFYPPMIFLIRPRFEAFMLARIASLDSLRLQNWNPTWEVKYLVEMIEKLLEKNGVVEVGAAENDIAAFPLGSHCALENLLFQLGLETSVEPRANSKYSIEASQKHQYSPQILSSSPTTSSSSSAPLKTSALSVSPLSAQTTPQEDSHMDHDEDEDDEYFMPVDQTPAATTTPAIVPAVGTAVPKSKYWAKGTGYGHGSKTGVEWNPEKWEAAQRELNRQLNTILEKISMNLDDPTPLSKSQALAVEESCLIPFLESNLRNDSLLDIVKNSGLFVVLFSILQKFCQHAELAGLLHLLPHQNVSLGALVKRMASAARPFVNFSRTTSSTTSSTTATRKVTLTSQKSTTAAAASSTLLRGADGLPTEDLELVIAKEIIRLDELIEATLKKTAPWFEAIDVSKPSSVQGASNAMVEDHEQRYLNRMQDLQFGEVASFDSHKYQASSASSASVGRRILLETSTWASGGLPLISSSSVFLRKSERCCYFFFFFFFSFFFFLHFSQMYFSLHPVT